VKLYVSLGFLARFAAVVALFTAAVLAGAYLSMTAIRAHTPPESLGHQILMTGLAVSTIVVLLLVITLLVAHVVILTRPVPRLSAIEQERNYRLREIAANVHSAIEAGRRW
jgi:hypothetical protein